MNHTSRLLGCIISLFLAVLTAIPIGANGMAFFVLWDHSPWYTVVCFFGGLGYLGYILVFVIFEVRQILREIEREHN